jgi:hypothetical protein
MTNPIEHISPDQLHFDYRNPRIAEFGVSIDDPEQDIIKILWDVMDVQEIVLSIKASGFFTHEPLIVIKENDKNIVIEGNRRLAAIKCIVNPDIADYIGINGNLLQVDEGIRGQLQSIPIIYVDDRKEAWRYIGFKHINGPAKWGSYAKAQYISEIKNEFNIPLSQIAIQIGDTHNTVQKLYQGLQVIEQAESVGIFDRTDITANRLYFSHLYTGLGYEGFKDFLGLKNISEETENPVPADKIENLGDLLTWMYGSKKREIPAVIRSQNPDLRNLEEVVKNKESLFALRDGVSLAQALEISKPKTQTFEQSLLEAKRALQRAQTYFTEGFDGKDEALLKQAGTIAQIADDLYESMVQRHRLILNNGKKDREFKE